MFKKMFSWKWVKGLIVKKMKSFLSDEQIDKWRDAAVENYDSGLTDEQEREHIDNFKNFVRPLLFAYIDKWAGTKKKK